MAKLWIALHASWKLEDVQAVLNVVISVLSTMGIFVFARFCWQGATARVAQSKNVRLSSLISLSTPGEVYDVALLLKFKLLSLRYLKLVIQCVVVISMSATTLLSGPIARYSTRGGHVILPVEVQGSLASDTTNSLDYATVEWDQIQASMNRAGFPENQLLDFLPDTSTPWVYRPEEWNSTWSLHCEPTQSTSFDLFDTGNCSGLYTELPALLQVLPEEYRDYTWYSYDGFYVNESLWKDVLMFIVAPLYINYDNDTGITYAMNMSIASIHLHGIQKQTNTSSSCHFGTGIVEHASYTRADCSLNRPHTVPDENHMAYPNSGDVNSIPTGYTEYFQGRFTQESTSDSEITVITPDVLVRFYQAYLIAKDTLYREPVARVLSVELPNVELSTIFLIFCLLVTLLLAVGLTKYLLFMLKHRATMMVTPETKLDWMLQSLKEAAVVTTSPVADKHSFRRSDQTFSSTISEDLTPLPKAGTLMTAEFEAATYGALDEESQMLGQNRVRRGSVRTGLVTMARGHGKPWAQQSPLADQANSYLLPGWHAAYADHSSCCNR